MTHLSQTLLMRACRMLVLPHRDLLCKLSSPENTDQDSSSSEMVCNLFQSTHYREEGKGPAETGTPS